MIGVVSTHPSSFLSDFANNLELLQAKKNASFNDLKLHRLRPKCGLESDPIA
jgi:hypothetical protein